MVDEFFCVTQWANAYMYIMSSMYMPMYVPPLNKDFTIIIIIIITSTYKKQLIWASNPYCKPTPDRI